MHADPPNVFHASGKPGLVGAVLVILAAAAAGAAAICFYLSEWLSLPLM